MSETFPIPLGRYRLLERLAIGGMAELFVAEDTGDPAFADRVVIKRLLPHMVHDPRFNSMFIDEAQLTSRLRHPKIARTYELGHHGEHLYIVMEHVDGIDVLAMLRECAHRRQRVPPEIAVYIAHEVLDALAFAHARRDDDGEPMGVVHRDISPSNVLLSRRGEVKLVDFGIARARMQTHRTGTGSLKGKYGYMSPEQVVDSDVDARSDLFSLGIVLAEMLTGRRLFAAPNELDVLLMVRDARLSRLDRFGVWLPSDLDAIVRKSLAKSPDERYERAADFRDALAAWLFSHAHDVTPASISRIVDSLYDDARRRKTQQIDEARSAAAEARAESGRSGKARAAPVGESGLDAGIPLGYGMSSDSFPVVSIEAAAQNAADEIAARVQRDDLTERTRGELDELDEVSELREFTADGVPVPVGGTAGISDALERAFPTENAGQGSASNAIPSVVADEEEIPTTRFERVEGDGVVLDVGDLDSAPAPMDGDAVIGRIPLTQFREGPARPPSLVAGLASLSPQGLDPSALDFDDSEVSGQFAENRREWRAPTPSDIRRAPPAPPALDDIDAHPDDHGSFAESTPIAVLFRLAVSRATGLLVVSVGGIRKEIYFRDGVPEYVSSNVAKELFGEYLSRRGVLSEGELAMALAMMPHYGGKLGDTLVGLGLMKPLEVFRELSSQVRMKLIDVCTWSNGAFSWYAGRENTRDAFPLDLNAYEVLGAGAMALTTEHMFNWMQSVEDERPRMVATGRAAPDAFQLGDFMNELCDNLDGVFTVRELYDGYDDPNSRSRMIRFLYLLVHTGLAIW